jgi:aminopeptidase S
MVALLLGGGEDCRGTGPLRVLHLLPSEAAAARGQGDRILGKVGEVVGVAAAFDDHHRCRDVAGSGVDQRAVVTLHVNVSTEERTATNVIGSSAGTDDGPTLMLGAHLDSVIDGPGINDNGSGVSLVLELARAIGERPHRSPIRVGFWAGEELGTLGSIHYVESLSPDEQDDVAIYLNFDMVGSPNAGRWVYSTDQSPIGRSTTQRFLDWFDEAGLSAEPLDLGGGSDHASFARAGIPTGGLFTGANERLTDEQASAFGGKAGAPADPCYHLPCDTDASINTSVLDEMADAAATVVAELAGLAD